MLSDKARELLKSVSTATLTTVLFKRGFRNVFVQGVFLLNRDAPRMVGVAYTLRYIPAREDLDQLGAFEGRGHPQREAIEACPPGQVLVMDARRRDRGVDREPEVDHVRQRLPHARHDPRPALRTDDERELAVGVFDDRRRHRRARAFAGFDSIRDRSAAVLRSERKIGQLVVEQESTLGHQPASEFLLDRRRHRHRIAVGVDDRDV